MSKAANPDTEANRPVALARVEKSALAPQSRSGIAISGLETAILAFLQSKTSGTGVPVERRVFLTLAESAEFSGLPATFLRRLIASGKLNALKTGSGWRIARAEIEKLSGTLTNQPIGNSDQELREMELNRLRRKGLPIP